MQAGEPIGMGRPVANWPCLTLPSQASNIPFIIRCHKQSRFSVPQPICRPARHLTVDCGMVDFFDREDDPIQPAHHNSTNVYNLPTGQVLPSIFTPSNKATAPLPGEIQTHLNRLTSKMVFRWGGRGGFDLFCPEAL